MPGCRLRVRPAGAPVSLGHDRRGVGGARSAGAGGDGRVAARPGRTSDGPPAAGRGGRDPLPGPLRGGVAGAAGGLPAVAGGVRVLRTVGCPGSAPAGGRPAARAAAGGRRARRTADRGGDRLPVGQGRGHGRGRHQRIRWRKEDQGPQAARRGGQQRMAAGRAGHRGQRAGPRRRSPAGGAAAGTVLHDHAGVGRRRVRRAAGRLGRGRAGPDRHRRQAHRQPRGFVVLPRRWVVERSSAGSTGTGAWSATTSGGPSTTRPWCCGPPP